MSDPTVAWPPTHEQRALLAQLAALLRQFGAARMLTAPVVRADERDFPETWEPTLEGVQRVLHRLCWHAHWDPEVVVRDLRQSQPPDGKMLQESQIELATAAGGTITFDVARIGNDDVAGLLSHRIGLAFLELAPGDPFRHAEQPLTEPQGSVAAVYLGLGVLVANSAMYRRYASRVVARSVVEEQYVAQAGGLSIGDATFLLAVQDIVREDASPALETLLKPQREWLERWRAVLDPHEDELRTLLELDAAPDLPLERRAVPRVGTRQAERDLRKFNAGRITFRVPYRSNWAVWLGLAAGMFGFLLPHPLVVGPGLMVTLAGTGRMFLVRDQFLCADTQCGRLMDSILPECPGCGGTIAKTIAHANDRLDALEEIEREHGHDDHDT